MEEFKEIKGVDWLEGCYVSNYGRIKKPNGQFYPRYYNNNTVIVCEFETEEAWKGRGRTENVAKLMCKVFYKDYDEKIHNIKYLNDVACDVRLDNIQYKEKFDVAYKLKGRTKEVGEVNNTYTDKEGNTVVVYQDRRMYINEWVDSLKEKEVSNNTIRSYVTRMEEYYKYNDKVTKQSIIDHKNLILNQGKSPKTVNLFISSVKSYLTFIADYLKKPDLLLIVNSLKSITIQRITHLENVITEKEVNTLLEYCQKKKLYKWYYIILTLANTGARVSELVTFKAKGVNEGYFEVIGKGGKYRKILIPDGLKTSLKDWIKLNQFQNEDYLFTNDIKGQPITTRGIAHKLKDIAQDAGIKHMDRIYPHSFRHYFAKKLLKETKDISFVSNMLGHSSVAVTSIYTMLSLEEQQKLLKKALK